MLRSICYSPLKEGTFMRLSACVCREISTALSGTVFVVYGEVIHVFTSVSPSRQMLKNLMVQQLAVQAPLPYFLGTFCTPQR